LIERVKNKGGVGDRGYEEDVVDDGDKR